MPRGERLGIALCAILNLSLWNILVLYGVDLMNSGRAAILAYTMPLWATLTGAFLLREGLSGRSLLALALGMGAMGLLFFAEGQALGNSLAGPLLVIAAAMSWGAGTALVQYYNFTMPLTVVSPACVERRADPGGRFGRSGAGGQFWPAVVVQYGDHLDLAH